MKKVLAAIMALICATTLSAQELTSQELAVRNLERAIAMNDAIFDAMYDQRTHRLYFYYNVNTQGRANNDVVSVWEYTAALEAVNSVLEGLIELQESNPELYEEHFSKNVKRMENLYKDMDYYKGTFSLVSYTGRNTWSPYGVHRANNPGQANVAGIENVYDDQMWIIRELIRAYRATNVLNYLKRAEDLTLYVLDGWDCTLKPNGEEYGGITWGPGYTSKHACSNSPIISPLVWLHEIYANGEVDDTKGQDYYELDADGKRVAVHKSKADFYLDFAKKIYAWQRNTLIDNSRGVYYDGIWSVTGDITTRTVDGVEYRNHVNSNAYPQGTYHTYNTGTMISGAADLYRVTGDEYYLHELETTATKAYTFFTTRKRTDEGMYFPMLTSEDRSVNPSKNGNPWFNQVLFRGFVAGNPYFSNIPTYLKAFQSVLDYGYDHYLECGILPINLMDGWTDSEKAKSSVQYSFSRVSEYALLVKFQKDLTAILPVAASQEANPSGVYNIKGQKVAGRLTSESDLATGLYIVDGHKVAKK